MSWVTRFGIISSADLPLYQPTQLAADGAHLEPRSPFSALTPDGRDELVASWVCITNLEILAETALRQARSGATTQVAPELRALEGEPTAALGDYPQAT